MQKNITWLIVLKKKAKSIILKVAYRRNAIDESSVKILKLWSKKVTVKILSYKRQHKGVIFDRDGTLNQDDGYTYRPDQLVWLPGAIETIKYANENDIKVLVATNQSGIGRGLYTEEHVENFHEEMNAQLKRYDAQINAFYICAFHPDAVQERYRVTDHSDRKPNAGMLNRAMREHFLDPNLTIMIGDRTTDVIAADRAGIRSRLIKAGELSPRILQDFFK